MTRVSADKWNKTEWDIINTLFVIYCKAKYGWANVSETEILGLWSEHGNQFLKLLQDYFKGKHDVEAKKLS